MSFMSFFQTTEADLIKVLGKIKDDVVVLPGEINAALKWLAGNTPAIAADIQSVLSIVEVLGVATNPAVATAVADANLAVTALNAYAAASNAGKPNVQAVVQGYVALQQANAAVALAKSASAITVAAPAAPLAK